MGTLTVISGPAAGRSLEVDRELTIGREDADLTLDDEGVSRRHAVLGPAPDGITIRDLGSRNGTFVNGARVADTATLHSTGTLQVGDTQITVEPAAAPAVAPAPPAARPVPP